MHLGLVLLSGDLIGGLSQLRNYISRMNTVWSVIDTSTVYKRYLNNRREDLNAELIAVIKFQTRSELAELLPALQRAKINLSRVESILLSLDIMTKLNPEAPLPHPLLSADETVLRAAVEVWPQYEHPIARETLAELFKKISHQDETEFFAQGFRLLSDEKH